VNQFEPHHYVYEQNRHKLLNLPVHVKMVDATQKLSTTTTTRTVLTASFQVNLGHTETFL